MDFSDPEQFEDEERLASNARAVTECAATKCPSLHLDVRSLDEVPDAVWGFAWLEELRLSKSLLDLNFYESQQMFDRAAANH